MKEIDAHLLRVIGQEVANELTPESEDSSARSVFSLPVLAQSALNYFAADLDVLPAIAEDGIKKLCDALDETFQLLVEKQLGRNVQELQDRYNAVLVSNNNIAHKVEALRSLAADMIYVLTEMAHRISDSVIKREVSNCQRKIGVADKEWVVCFNEATQKKNKEPLLTSSSSSSSSETKSVTPETLTDYFRKKFPDSPSIQVTQIRNIPGGASKKTQRIKLKNCKEFPDEIVMRQDIAPVEVSVEQEYKFLRKLYEHDLPVPKVLYLEAEESELGLPFLLVPFIKGAPPGDYWTLHERCPNAYKEIAIALGKLHSQDPATFGLSVADRTVDPFRNHLVKLWTTWRNDTLRESAFIDFVFSWAVQQCGENVNIWSPVHGTFGPHNILVDNDQLTAILDWEFMHAGDPVEDLGRIRISAEEIMPWDEFMGIYREAGGPDIPDRRISASMVEKYLWGATSLATIARKLAEGGQNDFIKTVSSYCSLRQIELQIIKLMEGRLD